ncbi:hypothetical protein [Lysobacter sp. FW306-1B-D06B]|uniref:hypothetical protein n=1 Tax=Lysobacter sp. FW306-1B-D06B TaxID=3140250 RepID=UPI00314029AB
MKLLIVFFMGSLLSLPVMACKVGTSITPPPEDKAQVVFFLSSKWTDNAIGATVRENGGELDHLSTTTPFI